MFPGREVPAKEGSPEGEIPRAHRRGKTSLPMWAGNFPARTGETSPPAWAGNLPTRGQGGTSPPSWVGNFPACGFKICNAFSGMVAALTNESATSKSVYFAHCTSEMIFITHLLTEQPEKLAGPLLADTYVTLLKGRNAWYGQMLAKGELSLDMGDSIKGKGMIQGVSAVGAFYELLSQSSLNVIHPEEKKPVAPAELCPILKTLYKILITREYPSHAILQALRDETMNDPRERIEIAQSHAFYRPSLLGAAVGGCAK
ncbi:hypothetical protein Taro_046850 [Colocasia esculenta]|uniref:Glycerol-3-phosphate dehydrogenase NAD-dependent C-terminal domain-containing protein n=1 Tax=Colocasia esculenta TaxID=4460 RepID=A0A843X6L6_COLES|nr:hypothetical protein [Colocasia esculenta]